MPTCLKATYVGTQSGGPAVFYDSAGSAYTIPYTLAQVVVRDKITSIDNCGLLALSSAEYAALKVSSGESGSSGGGACANPFSMSAEDGGLLSAAIVGCWAAAYFVRSVINVVKNGVES
jgi:hypothetical protein